jgi:hypothetical protein
MRNLVVISVLVAAALPAAAGPREETLAGISRCAGLPDDRTFLDCIYGAAQPMRSALGLPAALPSQQHLVPPAPTGYAAPPVASTVAPPVIVPPSPRMAAAAPPRTAPKVGVVDSLLGSDPTANWMEAFSFDSHHLFTVTFSNGQIWRQNAGDVARAHWTGRASDFSLKLAVDSTGRNGQLTVRGDASPYQVHRIH